MNFSKLAWRLPGAGVEDGSAGSADGALDAGGGRTGKFASP